MDAINTASFVAADAIDSDNGDNGDTKDKTMQLLFDGMTCRLSKTATTTGMSSLQLLDDPTDRSVPVGRDVDNAITDPLWAPVILRVLNPSILNNIDIEVLYPAVLNTLETTLTQKNVTTL